MNDNVNKTGSNWRGRAPRTSQEAFGIRGDLERTYKEQERLARRSMRSDVVILCIGLFVGWALMKVGAIVGM